MGGIENNAGIESEVCLLTLYEMPWGHTLTMQGPLIRKGATCRPNAATRADSSEGHRNPLCTVSREEGQVSRPVRGRVRCTRGEQGAAAHCQAVDWREVEQ